MALFSRLVLSSLLVSSVGGCSLLFALFSGRNECDPDTFTNRCDGDISELCVNDRVIRIDCTTNDSFCNDVTKECEVICGDGFVGASEDCDLGLTPDGERDENCNFACQKIDGCGDGTRSATEDCDDGNNTGGDGCDVECRFEAVSELLFDQQLSLDHGTPAKPEISQDTVIRGDLLRQRELPVTGVRDDFEIFRIKNESSQEVNVRADVLDPRRGNQSCGLAADFPNLSMVLGVANSQGVPFGGNSRRSQSDDCPGLSFRVPPGDFVTLSLGLASAASGLLQSEYLLVIDFDAEVVCGDDVIQTTEQCDSSNRLLCDNACQLVPLCGNSVLENIVEGFGAGEIIHEESCDDGNQTPGDGCDESCHREDTLNEQEPNGAASLSPGFSEISGNDFTTQNLQRITASTLLLGNIEPAGDEDIFELQNTDDVARVVRVETHSPNGTPCSATFNALINIRDANGALLVSGGFQATPPDPIDACSKVDLSLQPQELVYVQILKYGDNRRSPNYLLRVDFSDCGNGQVEPSTEECDDGNTQSGDGCNECQREPACGDGLIDAPERCDDANTTPGDGCNLCQLEAPTLLEDESNNTIAEANLINHSSIISASFDRTEDPPGIDIYKITNESPKTTEVILSIHDPALGEDLPCGEDFLTTTVTLQDSILNSFAFQERAICPTLRSSLGPGQTQFLTLTNFVDEGDYLLNVQFVRCGDGVIEGREECDAPDGVSCDAQCQRIRSCGDSFVDAPETCDDGNTTSGDGCDACRLEGFETIPVVEDPDPPLIVTENALLTGFVGVPIPYQNVFAVDSDPVRIQNVSSAFSFVHVEILSPRANPSAPCLSLGLPFGVLPGVGEDGCQSGLFLMQPGDFSDLQIGFSQSNGITSVLEGVFYTAKVEFSVCGDGRVSPGEECDSANNAACDPQCQRVADCGDGLIDLPERCDDGNTSNGDDCPSDCDVINFDTESEPNDDGSPAVGSSIDGNDFSSISADGPFLQDILLSGALSPAGDEDVFAVQNPFSSPARLRADTFSQLLGLSSCFDLFDTVINIRDAAGNLLAQNDDRFVSFDLCAGLDFILAPGQTVFVQVLDRFDVGELPGYFLQLSFTPIICGDGQIELPELCDDNNTTSGDGCSSVCQIEAGFACEEEPSVCHPIICGDGVLEFPESCDDGNVINGDGCDALCNPFITAQESEPNEDGTLSTSFGTNGSDFDSSAANGPFSGNTLIRGSISPLGDEDLFLFTNTSPDAVFLRLDIFRESQGLGLPCGSDFDTALNVKDNNGNIIVANDDRSIATDFCSGLDVLLLPGEGAIAQVLEANEDRLLFGYLLLAAFTPLVCGDGILAPGEQCDDINNTAGDGCAPDCDVEPGFACLDEPSLCHPIVCGDGIRDLPEECDDGNLTSGDGCSSACVLEPTPEIEPNEDGSPSPGGDNLNGNDFSIANAQGPFTSDVVILGSFTAGDEDVFSIQNTGSSAVQIQVQTFDPEIGLGASCGGFFDGALDTVLTLRSADGITLIQNDERVSAVDSCSIVSLALPPGELVFVHALVFGDNTAFPGYLLEIRFL